MMQSIPVRKAVGHVLAHDVTRIVPGQGKGPAFKKGHIIQEQDIETLLDIGKAHIYVLELSSDQVHEDDAARRIAAAAAGTGIKLSVPSEGRVNLIAELPGLLKVDVPALNKLNSVQDVVFATLHRNHRVVTYGAPLFPGAMYMLAYIGDIPVLGLPGCVMYHQTSVFDLIVPWLLAGERLTRDDIVQLGHGGFCAGCPECRYPLCAFGKV